MDLRISLHTSRLAVKRSTSLANGIEVTDVTRNGSMFTRTIATRVIRDPDRGIAAALPEFESTCQRPALGPFRPEVERLFHALRGNQEQIYRLIGLDAGTVSYADFFSEQNCAYPECCSGRTKLGTPRIGQFPDRSED